MKCHMFCRPNREFTSPGIVKLGPALALLFGLFYTLARRRKTS